MKKIPLITRARRFFIKNILGIPTSYGFGMGDSINTLSNVVAGVPIGNCRISVDSLYSVWRNHGDVFACVRELSDNCGAKGYMWVNATDSKKDPSRKSVDLAEQVLGKNKSFKSFRRNLVRDASVAGNFYCYIERDGNDKPLGLTVIDPRTISVVTDQYGTIFKWIQRVGAETKEFKPDEIKHFKRLGDPNSTVFGLSPIEPIVWEIRTDLAGVISNYAMFMNDSRPAAQYILEDGLGEEEQKAAVALIQDQLKGPENRHKSVVMKGVKEIKESVVTNKDMEYSLLRAFTTEKICSAFGVPKAILNYTDKVNLANGQEQTQKFWEGTIEPLQDDVQDFINNTILPALGIDDIRLEFRKKTFEDKKLEEESTRLDLEHGVLTINEVRELRGYEKYDPAKMGEGVDQPIVWGALASRPVEDIGVDSEGDIPDTLPNAGTDDDAAKGIRALAKIFNYGRKTANRK